MLKKHLATTVVIGSLLVGCTIARPEKYLAKAAERKPYDALIVPGVTFLNAKWDSTMEGRVRWAVLLYEQGFTKRIIFSGNAVRSPYVEARIMALYAEQLGVPSEAIVIEPLAEHSTENLFYGWKLAKAKGWNKVALASDRFQSKTLKMFNRKMKRKVGAEVDFIPMVEDSLRVRTYPPVTIDPSSAYVQPFTSLVERESFFKRLGGTLGKHIDWDAP